MRAEFPPTEGDWANILLQHKRSTNLVQTYVCVFCANQKTREFKHVSELRRHVKEKHALEHDRWNFHFPRIFSMITMFFSCLRPDLHLQLADHPYS